MKMPQAPALILLQTLLLLSLIHPGDAWVEFLKPPAGNSPQIRAKATNGHHTYKCLCEKWQLVSGSADLLSISDSKTVVGVYSFTRKSDNAKHHGTWTLYNNPADAVESGSRTSTVTGKVILSYAIPGSLSEALLQATSHQNQGVNELISYIQQLNPHGGVPWTKSCQPQQGVLTLPFYAEYEFWRQDMVPPSVPQSLKIVLDVKPVQNFFGEGEVLYLYSGAVWEQRYVFAKLYNIPGGKKVGSYYITAKAHESGGNHSWELSDPNGVQVIGKITQPPVAVSNTSLPWMTTIVTSHSGSNSSYLKNAKAVQMLSTRGGMPIGKGSKGKLYKGQLLRIPFTAVFWFFG